MIYFTLYLIAINELSFFLMGLDKRQAQYKGPRIAEKAFFALAIAGGSFGIWFGMRKFRHKTRHLSFQFGIPIFMIINVIIIIRVFYLF